MSLQKWTHNLQNIWWLRRKSAKSCCRLNYKTNLMIIRLVKSSWTSNSFCTNLNLQDDEMAGFDYNCDTAWNDRRTLTNIQRIRRFRVINTVLQRRQRCKKKKNRFNFEDENDDVDNDDDDDEKIVMPVSIQPKKVITRPVDWTVTSNRIE